MNLEGMCQMAARYSDRYDEFERTLEGTGNMAEAYYEDDALHYFTVFRDAINEAHREVSRIHAMPDTWKNLTLNAKRQINLMNLDPAVYAVKALVKDGTTVDYSFETKYLINVDANPGDVLRLQYHYIPEDMEALDDEPFFTDTQVDPMVYVCLAVARMWYSEKKFDYGDRWLAQYQMHLRAIRSSLKDRSRRRIPRGVFR